MTATIRTAEAKEGASEKDVEGLEKSIYTVDICF